MHYIAICLVWDNAKRKYDRVYLDCDSEQEAIQLLEQSDYPEPKYVLELRRV